MAGKSTKEVMKKFDEMYRSKENYKKKHDLILRKYLNAKTEMKRFRQVRFILGVLESSLEPGDCSTYLDLDCYPSKEQLDKPSKIPLKEQLDKLDFHEMALLVENQKLENAWNAACRKKQHELLKRRGRK